MNFTEYLKDNNLIVCPDEVRDFLLDHMSRRKIIVNVRFMNKEEFRKNWFFDYDVAAVKYLVEKHSLTIDNAKELLENLYYVEGKDYGNEKLNALVSLRKELMHEKLLLFNPYFRQYVSQWNAVTVGYGEPDSFEKSYLPQFLPYEINDRQFTVHCFKTIDEETAYVYDRIADLLSEGISINHIYVLGLHADYEEYINRHNAYYGFSISVATCDSLISTSAGQEFVRALNEKKSREEIYESFRDRRNGNVFTDLLNEYAAFELDEVRDYLIDDLRKKDIKKTRVINAVRNCSFNTPFKDSDHVFVLGFNENMPAMMRDTEYISDNIAPLVNMPTSLQRNTLSKQNLLGYLSGISNLTMTYCERSPFKQYEPSVLLDERFNVIQEPGYESFRYSELHNREVYGRKLDLYRKFAQKDDDLFKLYNTYADNGYLSYDNSYEDTDEQHRSSKVTLSYSAMDTYYKCAFRYYLEHVLKLGERDKIFAAEYGTLCHHVLEHAFEEDFDFDSCWDEYVNSHDVFTEERFRNRERFFLEKIRREMKLTVEVINEQRERIKLKEELHECSPKVHVSPIADFVGKIDKTVYAQEDGTVYAAIIDYKTGKGDISIENAVHGLSLQLPSYLYLFTHGSQFKNCEVIFCGFFLQHIINEDNRLDKNETSMAEKKRASMKLDGFFNSDMSIYRRMEDLAEGRSPLTVGLAVTKQGGLYANTTRGLLNEEIEDLIELEREKINEAAEGIVSGEFYINPKILDGRNVSCQYCPYKGICYRRDSNKKYLDSVPEDKEKEDDSDEMD